MKIGIPPKAGRKIAESMTGKRCAIAIFALTKNIKKC
jgi:hypothetical protein